MILFNEKQHVPIPLLNQGREEKKYQTIEKGTPRFNPESTAPRKRYRKQRLSH